MDPGDGKVAWPAENERAKSLQELKSKEERGLRGTWCAREGWSGEDVDQDRCRRWQVFAAIDPSLRCSCYSRYLYVVTGAYSAQLATPFSTENPNF